MDDLSDGGPTVVRQDPVEQALAAGVRALADAMTRAEPQDLAALANRMATLARELEARRVGATAAVVQLETARKRSHR